MLAEWRFHIRAAVGSFLVLSAVTGVAYPLAVTAVAQGLFPHQANGSLLVVRDQIRGSELIGQPFDDPEYFWSRPSATAPVPYHAAASAGSNWGPLNPSFRKAVQKRIDALRKADPATAGPIPADLVMASASGLDPHISPPAAEFQAERVAKARGIALERVRHLVAQFTEPPEYGILGEPRVNVLKLNLALDSEEKHG